MTDVFFSVDVGASFATNEDVPLRWRSVLLSIFGRTGKSSNTICLIFLIVFLNINQTLQITVLHALLKYEFSKRQYEVVEETLPEAVDM